MTRRSCKPKSVERFCRHATELCAARDWRTVSQIPLDGAVTWLGEQRAAQRWSGTTHDGVASALRCWAQFMADHQLTPLNVLARLEGSGDVGGEGSRAMRTDEARAIIAAARRWETTDRRVKSPLALWYTFLCLSGLRVAEAGKVRWRDLTLIDGRFSIVTDPAWSKNAKRMEVPINTELAGLLEAHRRASPANADAPIFRVTPNRHTFGTVLNLSGVRYQDDRMRIVSQHSCRKWLATELDRLGASPGIQALALRHFEGVTQKHYTDRLVGEAREYFERLPSLWPVEPCDQITNGGPAKSGGPDACKGPEESIGCLDGQARSSGSSTQIRAQMPIPVGKSVLDGATEAHLKYLEIVALALRSGDGSGTHHTSTI